MKWLVLALSLLAAAAPALAQEPAAEPSPSENPLSASLNVGYDSRYLLYGYRLSRHLYKADLYLSRSLAPNTTLWGGAWYGYLTDGTYNELDLYTGIDHALRDHLTVGLAYSLFNYLEVPFPADDPSHEIAAHATFTHDALTLSLRSQYDNGADGFLLRGIATWSQPLRDRVALVLNGEAGYSLRYYIPGNLWNHALLKASLPVTLTDTVMATPFVARTIPLEAIRDFEEYDTLFGLSFSFAL